MGETETPALLNKLDHSNFSESSESSESNFSDFLSISRMMDLAVSFDKVYTPFLCILGTLGNCLSILVFYTKYHKTHTSLCSSLYLSVLALSDTGFLLSVFIIWLQNIGVDVLNNDFSCPAVMYLGQVTGFLSVWFIVSFTVERFFAVCYPLSPATRFTLSRAKKIVVGLTLFSLIIFSYVFLIARVLPIYTSSSNNATDLTADSYNNTGSSEFDRSTTTNLTNASLSYLECETDELPPSSGQAEDFHSEPCDSTTPSSDYVKTEQEESINSTSTASEYILRCSVPREYFSTIQILNYVDSLVTFLIPFFIIAILNLRIMFCVKRVSGIRRNRETMISSVKRNNSGGLRMISSCNRGSSNHRRPKLKDYLGPKLPKPKGRDRSFVYRNKSQHGTLGTELTEGSKTRPNKTMMARCCRCQEIERRSSSSGNDSLSVQLEGNPRHTSVYMKSASTAPASKSLPSSESDEQSYSHNSVAGSSAVDSITVLCSQNCMGNQTDHSSRSVLLNPSPTEIRVTKTLLLVSSVFLILNFPSHSIRIATFINIQFSGSEETLDSLFVAQHWANFLFNTNFAVNFLLYCYSGKTFRLALKNLFSKSNDTSNHKCRAVTTSATTQLTLNTMDIHRSELKGRYGRRFSSFSKFAEDQV